MLLVCVLRKGCPNLMSHLCLAPVPFRLLTIFFNIMPLISRFPESLFLLISLFMYLFYFVLFFYILSHITIKLLQKVYLIGFIYYHLKLLKKAVIWGTVLGPIRLWLKYHRFLNIHGQDNKILVISKIPYIRKYLP